MTFLQWMKKNKKKDDHVNSLYNMISSDKNKPKRCRSKSIWINYLNDKYKNDEQILAEFETIWKRYIVEAKLKEVKEAQEKIDQFLDNFKSSNKDVILFNRIMSAFCDLEWEVEKQKEWMFLAESLDFEQIIFRPHESGKGFVFMPEYSPQIIIPYDFTVREIKATIFHQTEFNEAYRQRYQKTYGGE